MTDLRVALRQLAARPAFTAVAVITLALGIGATTTIFSVVDHLMLRDLPFPEPDRIVTLWQANAREGIPRDDVAPGNYLDWKERAASFAAIGAVEPYSFDLTGDGRPEVVLANLVTDGFFDALGVRPSAGRLLQPGDFLPNAGPVAVLGWGLWQRRFGGDPSLIGRAIVLDGRPTTVVEPPPRPGEEAQTYVSTVTPEYFATLGIPLLRGRGFDDRDRFGAPPVAIINETLRRLYSPDRDPVGRRVTVGEAPDEHTPPAVIEIVGVMGDVRHTGLDAPPRPEMFFAQGQSGNGSMTYFVRADGDPAALIDAVQQVIWNGAPLQTFYQTGTLDALVNATLTGRRFTLLLIAVFAALALLMAAVGLYGVISFTVTQRTHEGWGSAWPLAPTAGP
jgi:hypothetical protein